MDFRVAVSNFLFEFGLHVEEARVVALQQVAQRVVQGRHGVGFRTFQLRFQPVLEGGEGFLVLAGLRDVEVGQLHHRLEVLGRAAAVDVLLRAAHGGCYADLLAGQHLGQLHIAEVSGSAGVHHAVHGRVVQLVGRVEEARAAQAEALHADFVGLEVGLLHIDLHAVGEGQFRGAEEGVVLLADNLSALGCFLHQRFVVHLVHVGFHLQRRHGLEVGDDFLSGGDDHAFLFRRGDEDGLVVVRNELLGHFVDGGYGDVGGQLVQRGVFILDARHGFGVQEVLQALVDVGRVVGLLALVVGRLQLLQDVGTGTGIFTLGEAVAAHTLHFLKQHLQGVAQSVVLGQGDYVEGFLGADQEEVAVGHAACHVEGRVGRLGQLVEARGQHVGYGVQHVVLCQVHDAAFDAVRRGVMLEVDVHNGRVHLLVLADVDDGLLVVGHGVPDALGAVLRQLDAGEERLYLLLHLVHVDVAHDDDALQVGAIPFGIVVADGLVGEVVDNVDAADGHAVGILGAGVERGLRIGVEAEQADVAAAPLLADDAAFLVNLLVGQQYGVAPVVQDEQAGVHDGGVGTGHVAYIINRLVHRGVGVEVGTELDAFRLAPLHDAKAAFVAGEVLRAVEGHVFQEVCKAALLGLFQDRAYFLCDVELYAVFGFLVVTDVVGQSVVQFSDAYVRVDRDGRQLLGKEECHVAADDGCGQKDFLDKMSHNVVFWVFLSVSVGGGGGKSHAGKVFCSCLTRV